MQSHPPLHPYPPSPSAPTPLAEMFTTLVSSLDVPSRRALAKILETCHTRHIPSYKAPPPDLRPHPLLFYAMPDSATQQIARPHLPPAPPPQETLEATLVRRMDAHTRLHFVRERFYDGRRECAQVGYRYLWHLICPERPMSETVRELPVVDYDETRLVDAVNDQDGEHVWSEEEDEDDDLDDGEESFCSDISHVTRESQLSDGPVLVPEHGRPGAQGRAFSAVSPPSM